MSARRPGGPTVPPPRVILAPELMPGNPVLRGSDLFSYSVRALIEQYLNNPVIRRKPKGQRWPSLGTLSKGGAAANGRWFALREQHDIDQLLRQIVSGIDPRVVFRTQRSGRGHHGGDAKARVDQAMAAEVMRLRSLGVPPKDAIALVQDAAGVDGKTVRAAVNRWGDENIDSFVRRYVQQLEGHGLI
jgi:hypothetical protein